MPTQPNPYDTPEWQALKHRINQDIINSTHNLKTTDIPLHLAHQAAHCILSLLYLYYAEQRDEFQMAKNALLHIPDIKKRWLTMPQVWNRTALPPDMGEEEAAEEMREFVVEGIREIIECRRDTKEVVERTEEWKRRWGRIDVVFDEEWEEKARRIGEGVGEGEGISRVKEG